MNRNLIPDRDEERMPHKRKQSLLWYIALGFLVIILLGMIFNDSKSTNSSNSSTKSNTSSSSSSSSSNSTTSGSKWEKRYFVDEFNDLTNDPYIWLSKNAYGTFSNSATTNSNLRWNFIITNEYVSFILYEYGYSQVKGFASYPDKYQVSIKESDGTITTVSASNSSDRVMIRNKSDYQKVINIMKKEKEIKISIKETGTAASSSYNLGSVDCAGFRTVYHTLPASL